MALEKSDQPIAKETIPRVVQNRLLKLCMDSGMPADQLLILHNILRNFDNPQLPEIAKKSGEQAVTIDDIIDHVRGKL